MLGGRSGEEKSGSWVIWKVEDWVGRTWRWLMRGMGAGWPWVGSGRRQRAWQRSRLTGGDHARGHSGPRVSRSRVFQLPRGRCVGCLLWLECRMAVRSGTGWAGDPASPHTEGHKPLEGALSLGQAITTCQRPLHSHVDAHGGYRHVVTGLLGDIEATPCGARQADRPQKVPGSEGGDRGGGAGVQMSQAQGGS